MSANPISGAMPTLRNEIEFFRANGLMRHPIQGGDGTDGDNAGDGAGAGGNTDADANLNLGDAGKKALEAERLRAKNAEKLAADHAKELETLRKEKAERESAKAAADEEEARKKGEFESLATKRAEELKAAMADKETTAKELERATRHLQSVIDGLVKELEATEDKDLIAGFPKDAPLLDQIDWLDDPRTKAAIKAATGKTETKRVPGGVTPRPNGTGKAPAEDEARRQRRAASAYSG